MRSEAATGCAGTTPLTSLVDTAATANSLIKALAAPLVARRRGEQCAPPASPSRRHATGLTLAQAGSVLPARPLPE